MAFLRGTVAGRWCYRYLILDLYGREIVGSRIHERDSVEHAAHLARRTAPRIGRRGERHISSACQRQRCYEWDS